MAIDLANRYLPYVDELFTTESKKSIITNNDFNWTGAHTVKVYSVGNAKMNDYNRNGSRNGSRYGDVEELSATTQEMMLTKDRSFTFEIDKLDTDETLGQVAAASALARQIREVVIPEIDTYIYNKVCENAGIVGNEIELSVVNIYEKIVQANTMLDDEEVPENGRVLIVSPVTYLLLKYCKDITMETDIGNNMRLKGVVAMIDGLTVIKVPSKRLPENFGFLITHPCSTIAPVKLEDYTIHQNPPGISGSLVEGRLCYDTFVLNNKARAIYYQPVSSITTLEDMANWTDKSSIGTPKETETE